METTKLNLASVKEDLKQRAAKIKTLKPLRKPDKVEERKALGIMDHDWAAHLCRKEKWDYRHRHIAYCLLRGTSYEKIECPSEDNKPNRNIIEKYVREFSNGTQDVCVTEKGSAPELPISSRKPCRSRVLFNLRNLLGLEERNNDPLASSGSI